MIRVAGIEKESIVDGPGIRTVLFLQGCKWHCRGCHNPQTWDENGGTFMWEGDILNLIRQNPLVKGVTYSGGEPFLQARELLALTKTLKALDYEVASYTGYTFEELLEGEEAQRELLSLLDILIDGPFVEEEKSLGLLFRGSRNQRILNVKKSLEEGRAVLEEDARWTG